MTTRRGFVKAAVAALAIPALPKLVAAEESWPARPIRAVIPFSAGSSVDIVGRIVLDPLAQRLGQPSVLGELIGGVLVGKSVLGLVNPELETIHLISELGVVILLFAIGLEPDLGRLMKVGATSLAVAQNCSQQGYAPHIVSDEGAYSLSFAGKPGLDGFIGTADNYPFFDFDGIPAMKTFYDAFKQYQPGYLTNPLFGVVTELQWTMGLLITEAAVKGKVGTTNPMTPAALFDGVYADSGTTLGGMTPPLTFIQGQSNENRCWFWVGINGGKFQTPYGSTPTCATEHPKAAASS